LIISIANVYILLNFVPMKVKKKKRATKYETKLAINGSFDDVMNVAVRSIKPPENNKKAKKKGNRDTGGLFQKL